MNDFQMSSLARTHTSTLLDEARRQRLASSGTRQSRPAQARRSLRLGLGSLLGRASA